MYWYMDGILATMSWFGDYGYIQSRLMHVQPTRANKTTADLGQNDESRVHFYDNRVGPFTNTWFFADAFTCQMIVEVAANVFTHLGLGTVEKYGTWTGGEFISGCYNNYYGSTTGWTTTQAQTPYDAGQSPSDKYCAVHNPIDGTTDSEADYAVTRSSVQNNQRARFTIPYHMNYTASQYTTFDSNCMISRLLLNSPNAFNNRATLCPTYLRLWDAAADSYELAGHVPGVRCLNIESIEPKAVVDRDGSEEWVVFPIISKFGDPMAYPVTGNVGIAYYREGSLV